MAGLPGTQWAIVVAVLGLRAKANTAITHKDHLRALRMCNGFGATQDLTLLYDWSHVRDSSPEAIAECATFLLSCAAKRKTLVSVIEAVTTGAPKFEMSILLALASIAEKGA